MTQLLRWLAPGEVATDLSERIDNGSEPRFALTVNAEESSIGSSTVVVRDEVGDFHIVGLNRFDVQEEDSISDDPFIYVGRFDERREKRGLGYLTGASRIIECNLVDLNAILSNYIISDEDDADRPSESHADRIAWLLGTDACALLTDDSLVLITSSVTMPEYDYTGMSPEQVVSDCARASGYQHFVWFNGEDEEFGLVYANSRGSWYSTDIRLSNVPSEVDDSTTFYLGAEAELQHDPSRVASRVYARGDGIDTVRTYDPTEDLFARRDVAMDFPTVRSLSVLNARTDRSLQRDLNTETITVKGSCYLPSTHASMFKAGMRFDLHATHLTGYQDEFDAARLLNTTHTLLTPTLYQVDFEAEPLTTSASSCDDEDYPPTETGNYPPNNSLTSAGTGNIAYHGAGGSPPVVPTPGYVGAMGFPVFGSSGSPDYGGDCVSGNIRFIAVGAGTMTFHTQQYGPEPSARTLTATLWHYDGASHVADETISGIVVGTDIVMDISTHAGEFCYHHVDVADNAGACGGKWGFVGVDWVSSEIP